MIAITSAQNPTLKRAIRLHDNRGRKQQGRTIIFGVNEIRRAVDAGTEIVELFTCQGAQVTNFVNHEVDHFELPEVLFRKLAFGQRNDGIVAIAKRPATDLNQFKPQGVSLILVLESIEKPGNIGAVFRSATAAGVDVIFLANPKCDVFHPNAIRSSLGTVFSTPVFCSTSEECKKRLLQEQFQIFATRVDATQSYLDCDFTPKTALVLGNESEGLSEAWINDDVAPVTIPMTGDVDSLNIAVSAALVAFEACRQRSVQ